MRKKIADMTDDELNLWMMGSSSRKKIHKLKKRLQLRNEKSAADRRAVEALFRRIVKLKAKQNKSVKAAENRLLERRARAIYVRAERERMKQINADLRAGVRQEKLREKHFTNRTSFKHVVHSMAEAQPNEIYRYHLGLCSFVHLTKALRSLGAPLEGDFRRPSFHMNDCQVFLQGNWTPIPIHGIDGEQAFVPVAPVEPVSVTPESVETPVVEETGPINFTERTTFEELMSGRVIVATLRERGPHEYRNDYSVKRLDHDKLFYAMHASNARQWHLIPGQAGPPPEPQPKIYTWQQGYEADAPAESQPVEQPQTSEERIARMAQLEKEIEELKAMMKEKSKDVQTN